MLDFKAPYIVVPPGAKTFPRYPDIGIADWHKKHHLYGKYTGPN